ncbi:MAG: hypothetical protein CM15mV74_350 [uncultured marine virus]|nr:MAG: hypothetical protein CM15mV74_350 [uncultured marine virus]
MAHPSNALPSRVYYHNGTNDIALTGIHYCYAIFNPTSGEVDLDLTGDIFTYQSDAYKEKTDELSGIKLPSGGTLYGRFTNIDSNTAGVICYVH